MSRKNLVLSKCYHFFAMLITVIGILLAIRIIYLIVGIATGSIVGSFQGLFLLLVVFTPIASFAIFLWEHLQKYNLSKQNDR